MTIRQQRNLRINIINRINHPIRLPPLRRRTQEIIRIGDAKQLVPAVEAAPGDDGLETLAQTVHFGSAHVSEGGHAVPVEGGQRHLVEVDDADVGGAGAGEGCHGVGADASDADDDDEAVAELFEAFVGEEDSVSCKLLEDELCSRESGLACACWIS
jgi:hypothetical protein